jgi:hypothetical protein
MVIDILTIYYVLSYDPTVLTHVIPIMERAQGLLDTLEAESVANRFLSLWYWSLFSLSI